MKSLPTYMLLLNLLTILTSNASISDEDHKALMERLDALEKQENLACQATQRSMIYHTPSDHEISSSLLKLSLAKQKK